MTNYPFESTDHSYLVLINHENQHSLWPEFAPVPGGWDIAFGPAPRAECVEFVERSWLDITPASQLHREQA